jgi:ankyrin repeat protein
MSQFHTKQLAVAQAAVPRSYTETNVHLFAEQGNLAEVTRCIEQLGEPVDKRDTRRQTPLHCACMAAHTHVRHKWVCQSQ